MIDYQEAESLIYKVAKEYNLKKINCGLDELVGHVCVSNVSAPLSIQPFDNSAMDGFAVIRSDLEAISNDNTVILQKKGIIAAGDSAPLEPLSIGTCTQIMTGAPVPDMADAVVPIELVQVEGNQIIFSKYPKHFDNIRRAGEDFKKGDLVLEAGQKISASNILALATLGIEEVEVYRKPRVAFLATGRELVDDFSKDLESGQIYNSNKPYAVAALKELGTECVSAQTIADDKILFTKALHDLMEQDLDIIISSGAVSAGEFDFVRSCLEEIGAEILFHKIKMKPGKPMLFAKLPNGTLYFGLPGNPVATAAGLRFCVYPALRAITGMSPEEPMKARAVTALKKNPNVQIFLKSRMYSKEDATMLVEFADGQASFMVSPFLTANCWAIAPIGKSEIKADDIIDIYSIFPNC